MNWKKDIGTRIRTTRTKLKLTQKKFGQALDISSNAISSYEMGDASPSIDKLIEIADYANVNLEWLISGREIPVNEMEKYLPAEERLLLKYFRRAADIDKKVVLRVAENAAKISGE